MSLAPNPSHLEAVDPVVQDFKTKTDQQYKGDNSKLVPILIHGDAALAGPSGVRSYTNGGLDGYKTGGTIHSHQQSSRIYH